MTVILDREGPTMRAISAHVMDRWESSLAESEDEFINRSPSSTEKRRIELATDVEKFFKAGGKIELVESSHSAERSHENQSFKLRQFNRRTGRR